MNVVFRVDASVDIGSGHVMRCLTLADRIKATGGNCYFICRDHPGQLAGIIQAQGYAVDLLPYRTDSSIHKHKSEAVPVHAHWLGVDWVDDAAECHPLLKKYSVDWLVVDHYGLDYRWQQCLTHLVKNVMVIDDLADRRHCCDLLLDQTLGRKSDAYHSLLLPGCLSLLGAEFILIRPEFINWRKAALMQRHQNNFKKLLINLGGVDKDNVTGTLLSALALEMLPSDVEITLVMGVTAPWLGSVRLQAEKLPWRITIEVAVNNMAQLLAEHDWAIGAAGGSSWERACLGLPTVMVVIAENQQFLADNLKKIRAVELVDVNKLAQPGVLAQAVDRLHCNYDKMVARNAGVCDGEGAKRVVEQMWQIDIDSRVALRQATINDCQLVYSWQKQPQVRLHARNQTIPSWLNHQTWFKAKLKESLSAFYLIEDSGESVGVVRLDPTGVNRQVEISIYLALGAEGKGYASRGLRLVRRAHPELDLLATVLANNSASHKLFERAGYQKINDEIYLSVGTNKKSKYV